MAKMDNEFQVREEYPLDAEEFSAPCEEAEFRPPDPALEDSRPVGTDYEMPDSSLEFTPPGLGGGAVLPSRRRRHRWKRLLLVAAGCLLLTAAWLIPSADHEPLLPGPPLTSSVPAASIAPQPSSESVPELTPEPTAEPVPISNVPVITTGFFCFSHEHHARVRMDNIGSLHSVQVTVRDKILDKQVYDHSLTDDEIASGVFELPVLSTGDFYMENMQAYDEISAWPEFEMTVSARYENETGDGEDTLTITREADFELGFGLSYMRSDSNWSEVIPSDSFYIQPWEEIDELHYVINDPEAVRDPLTISVDLSWNGRHAEPAEYEELLEKSEYNIVDPDTGESTPHVGYTSELVLRRPVWMPEEGTLHVCIVQYLASTGEQWVREYDFDYPQHYDWES